MRSCREATYCWLTHKSTTCGIMLDGAGVEKPCAVALCIACRQEVAKRLVVDLHIRRLQLVLPALLPQAIHGLQDLQQPTAGVRQLSARVDIIFAGLWLGECTVVLAAPCVLSVE